MPLRAYQGSREVCPVLVFQYHSRLLLLTLAVLTQIRSGESDLYRPGAPLPRLTCFWELSGAAGSARHQDAQTLHFILKLQYMPDWEAWRRSGAHIAPIQAGSLAQQIFCERFSGSDPWRIVQDDNGESIRGFQYDPQSSGCLPIVELDVGANGRVTVGPGWACGSLLQRIWLEAYKHLQDAVVTQCACGCREWQWLTGRRRDGFLEKGQRIWSKGHRSKLRNAELREAMTPKQLEQYRAAAKKRSSDARHKKKAEK
jgi:hypothetical protein